MEWITMLRRTSTARSKDVAIFMKWEREEINTEQAIRWMKRNNRMPDRLVIDSKQFEDWLKGLGYRRYRDGICKPEENREL